ncbi:hypothetical protein [Xanthomonas arboricola]|uniref:hypothetical protein n=1 Tax=Xanthomonas arboricola TaxID=56448 RepID=UPI0015E29FD2|nr:hypothetical protein [Xanthomonas arboricola]
MHAANVETALVNFDAVFSNVDAPAINAHNARNHLRDSARRVSRFASSTPASGS